jgi:hypothetical protein
VDRAEGRVNTLEVLTLVIAAAGVFAAAGAVWTGWETRRYARDTADALENARQTLEEQRRSWKLELQMTVFSQQSSRWDSTEMRKRRSALATGVAGWRLRRGRGMTPAEHEIGLEYFDEAVFDFFETLGLLLRLGYLDRELAWHTFSDAAVHWWSLANLHVVNARRAASDPTVWEDFEAFAQAVQQEDAKRRGRSSADLRPSEKDLDEFLTKEMNL